jgi:retron-type reverse transcriptase
MSEQLMEAALEPENWHAAWKAVVANDGAPGIDGMRCEELKEHLQRHGETIAAKLRTGRYAPSPVKRVIIPKPGGGERLLGIPTVMDRFVQQLLLQVLTPLFESRFSARSYGFRPGRSAHDGSPTSTLPPFPSASSAVRQAQAYVKEGKQYVVDLDIEKFFDRVHHDVLMHRIRSVVEDVRVRTLIGRYLKAGVMIDGVVVETEEGTPQGGPLSPLLANIYLDPLDRELEGRGLSHVRYADDCNIYVSSETAAARVFESIRKWIERHLRLRLNEAKSGGGPCEGRKFLGFSLSAKGVIVAAQQSIERFKDRVRQLWRRGQPTENQELRAAWNSYVRGWLTYFRLAEDWRWLRRTEAWCRRRIRCFYWQRWHSAAGRLRALRRLGVSAHCRSSAYSTLGAWCMAGSPAMQAAISNRALRRYYFVFPSELLGR